MVKSLKSGRKRTKVEREVDLKRMTDLMSRGYSQRMIRQEFEEKVTQQQICHDSKEVLRRLHKQQIGGMEEHRAVVMEQYDFVKQEMREAWEMSKNNFVKDAEFIDSEGRESSSRTVETRTPGVAYMQGFMSCLKAERELFALDKPTIKVVDGDAREEATQFLDAMLPMVRKAQEILAQSAMQGVTQSLTQGQQLASANVSTQQLVNRDPMGSVDSHVPVQSAVQTPTQGMTLEPTQVPSQASTQLTTKSVAEHIPELDSVPVQPGSVIYTPSIPSPSIDHTPVPTPLEQFLSNRNPR